MSDVAEDEHLLDLMRTAAGAVEVQLERLLSADTQEGEKVRPKRVLNAMRHGVLNGGKRFRPFLVLQSADLFGVPQADAIRVACALECLHCYSLIHDDLPAMDNDDLRRGVPTVHKAYDEATAILAGDALLTLAFDILSDPKTNDDAEIRVQLTSLLARASGLGGMIGGQALDIEAESRTPDEAGIRLLQSMKTGALIRYACEAGAVLGQASPDQRQMLVRYGEIIGLAFQLSDDLLDVVATSEQMGKATGKDAGAGKGTLVGLHGVEKVRAMLAALVAESDAILIPFGERADILRRTARFVAERRS